MHTGGAPPIQHVSPNAHPMPESDAQVHTVPLHTQSPRHGPPLGLVAVQIRQRSAHAVPR